MKQTSIKKETSIDWLMAQLYKKGFIKEVDGNEPINLMNQAKEMEKQQQVYNKEIVDILDNVRYWETCPDEYKVFTEKFIEQFKNKEEPIQEILENLENQLKKVIKEHPIDVNEDNYWRGVKIGLETAVEVIKFKVVKTI
jgi:hypothetical protein